MEDWLTEYYERYRVALFETNVKPELQELKKICLELKAKGNKLIMAGNGASATIASHAATDFTKQVKVRSLCFTDASLITAFGNDYGYENWVAEAIKSYYKNGDVVILISSSGSSKNIVNAAKKAKQLNLRVVTFSGFTEDNSLRQIGDLNFWLPSKAYNIIENTHSIWITTVVDMILGKAEYNVN
jgi:D-sedoheptulose 7-phosphate isomerase